MPTKKTASKTKAQTGAKGSYSHKRSETQLLIEQAALYRLSVALNHETELQAMMDVAVRAAAALFNVELAAISSVDEGSDTYSDKANIGWPSGMVSPEQHIPLSVNNGLTYAIRNRKVVAISDESKETRFGAPSWVLQMGIRSALIAPMIVGGKAIGGLAVNDRQPRDWSEGEQRLIALIANNTAEAIERVNLFGRLREGQNFIRRIAAASPNLIYVYDMVNGRSVYTNRAIGDILGYPHDQAGMDGLSALGHLMHPDDLKQYPGWIGRYATLKDDEVLETEYRLKHANGEWRWFVSRSMIFERGADGAPYQIIGTSQDITARKRVEEAHADLNHLLEESLNEIYIFEAETLYFKWANDGARHNLGYTMDELRALTPLDLKPEFNAQTFGELLQPLRTGEKQKIVFVTKHRRKDNSRYDAEVHVQLADFEGRQVFVAIILDITERKQAELILRESEERFSKIFQFNPVSIAITSFKDGRYVDVNNVLLDTLGYDSKDEVIGRTSAELNIWADPAEQSKVVEELRQHRLIRNMELRVRARGGEVRDVLLTLERIEINHQPFTMGFAIDITERKQAEELLKTSQMNLSALIENTQDSIWSVDANYRLIVFNATFNRLFSMAFHGRPTEGLVFMEYMPLEFKSAWKDFFDRALRGERFSVDYRYDFPNKPLDFEIAFNPIVAADGNITGVAVFARNVTERKHLELQQQRLTTALESAGEMILITDADVKIQYVNAAFEHITGYTRDEARGQNPNMLQGAKQEDEFYRAMWSALRQGDVWHGVVTDKKKSGDLFESENTIAPIYNASGNTIGYVSVQRDITERVQRERELEAIAQLSTALRTAATLIDMTPLLLDQLLDLLKVDSVALIMRDEASGDSVVEAIRGDPILIIGDRLAAGKGIAGYVMESGQPYLTQDVENDSRFMRRIMIQGQWAVAFAPLATRDQIIGVLFIARQSATIPTEDLRLLNTIGELAASAIHRASLHEQTRRRLGQLATLHNIDRAISSSFDLRLTLNIALDELTQYAGVGAASVLFLNSHFMMLEYAAERGFPRQTSKSPQLNINHSFAGRAVLERQAVVADLTAFKGFPHLEALAKDGFTRYDGVPLIAKGKIKGVLEVFSRPSFGAEQSWVEFLETVANGVSLAIDNMELFNGLQRSNSELGLAYDATLEGWSRALDLRDKETEGHTQRVTEMTLHLAHAMNIEVTEITQFRRGALLHDIGKLGVPDNILLKPGPLSDEEWDVMRKHPQYAYDMLLPIPFLTPALAIPYCHHEKWDGSGYPRGLRGESIPLAARIFAVADVWDALRSDRPYRKGWEEEKVRDHIREQSGIHFDPRVVEVFLSLGD